MLKMVRIAAGIPLVTITEGTEICGIGEKTEGDIFLLTSDRSITVFKPQDPKPLQSWVTKPSSRFTCTAVHLPDSDEYVAVINQKQIYRWASDNATPFKQKPKILKSAISQILSVDRGNALLLMCDGSLRSLDGGLSLHRGKDDGCLREGEEIREAWIWRRRISSEDGSSYIVCFVSNTQTKKQSILLIPIQQEQDHEGSTDGVIRLELAHLTNEERHLESATFSCDETTAVLHTLWEGGRLCSSEIRECDLRRHKGIPYLNYHHKCTIPQCTGKIRIAAIDERHIAVAGMQSKTTNDKSEASLCIWETAFGTLQSHFPLTFENADDDGTPSFLGVVSGHLLLATRRAVTLHRYECGEGSLAAALGRLSAVDQDQDLPVLGIDWTNSLVEETPVKKPRGRKSITANKTQTISKNSELRSSLLTSILDHSSSKNSKSFSSSVEKYMKACGDSQPDSTALVLILKNVVKRVEADPKFWCEKVLQDIIATKAVAASSCPEFVALLARKQELSLLRDCLQCMGDIPELTLVQCLQVFLSVDDIKLPCSCDTPETPMDDSSQQALMSSARRFYVDEVLSKPFTDSFLLDAVKHLQFKEVTSLLRYLHFLLTSSSLDIEEKSQVSMDNVIDWIGTLLDAHFAQLVLIPEVRLLLSHLKDAVKDQVQFSAELNVVRNLLHHTQNARSRVKANPSSAVRSYSIEVLKMK